MAAVLACGEDAVLSHRSAAELWALGARAGLLEVTAPSGHRPAGIAVHRAPVVDEHRTRLHGIPVTTPARTLVDLADVLTRRGLERAVDEAEYLRLDCAGLEPIPGRRGAGVLADVLERHRAGSTRTRTELEELFLALCDRSGIRRPEANVLLEGYEVDFLWRAERLVVEVDGAAAHRTGRGFEEDRRRDAELTAAGHRVMRFTYRRLTAERAAVAEQLRRAGAPGARGPRSRSRAGRRRRPPP